MSILEEIGWNATQEIAACGFAERRRLFGRPAYPRFEKRGAVRRQDDGVELEARAVKMRECADRRLARPIEDMQEGPLGRERKTRRRVENWREGGRCAVIAGPGGHGDSPLPRRRHELLD